MIREAPSLILIVDDDQAHRLMLSTLLEEWGYRTEGAEDGQKAVDFVRAHPVDLILMDMRMPNMDGIEATRKIKQSIPALPVIMMTAYSSVPSAREALQSGACDYLTKPLDFDALKRAMEDALNEVRLQQGNNETGAVPDVVSISRND